MARIADVSDEAILLAGGGAAILQQLANPVVAAGVAGHSDFAERPLDRLHGTLTYLYVI
ncbi:MAG TPA: oxygenase MpaB family protein, partial [Rhodoglobus sp.]|nr:oxygenase MpaB family protein [Rhodoglobus sp.]